MFMVLKYMSKQEEYISLITFATYKREREAFLATYYLGQSKLINAIKALILSSSLTSFV